MTERDLFLRALARNEDDVATRLVYSDWLDEQGECEEADRQRKWPAAKEWLVRFRKRLTESFVDPDAYTFKDVIAAGRRVILESEAVTYLGDDDLDLTSAVLTDFQEFCQNWSVVTGIPLPPDLEDKSYYWRCCANEEYHIGGRDLSRTAGEEESGGPAQVEASDARDELTQLQENLERERTKRRP